MGSLSENQRLQVVDKYEIPSNASCEYYEEVIEESEEEDDSQDLEGLHNIAILPLSSLNNTFKSQAPSQAKS